MQLQHRRLRRRPPPEAGGGLQHGRRTASSFYPGKNLPSLHSTFFFLVLLESSTQPRQLMVYVATFNNTQTTVVFELKLQIGYVLKSDEVWFGLGTMS